MGWFIPWLDKIAYIYILYPETQVSSYVRYQFEQRRWRTGIETLNKRSEDLDKLTTRSVLFQFVWVILAVFAVTSIPSWFGKALVMSLGLRILIEEWKSWLTNRQDLKEKLFWQVKREVSDDELKWYLYTMTAVYSGLVWWLV